MRAQRGTGRGLIGIGRSKIVQSKDIRDEPHSIRQDQSRRLLWRKNGHSGGLVMPIFSTLRTASSAAVLACAAFSAGCTTTQSSASGDATIGSADASLARMLAMRSSTEGKELDAKLAEASAHPLGSKENPVRAEGPAGQRAYLARLRCSDTSRPTFNRAGSAGISPYGNIVDIYIVNCSNAEPAESNIYIDMYHRGYVETESVPGFGIIGGRRP